MSEWAPIETAPIEPLRDEPLIMLWVLGSGDRGTGTVAIGRAYKSHDGSIRAVASGFHGNWIITHWMPLPEPPVLP